MEKSREKEYSQITQKDDWNDVERIRFNMKVVIRYCIMNQSSQFDNCNDNILQDCIRMFQRSDFGSTSVVMNSRTRNCVV